MPQLGTQLWLQQQDGESSSDYSARILAWDASDKRTPEDRAATQARLSGLKRSLVESGDLDPANADGETDALQAINRQQTGYDSGSAPDSVLPGLSDWKLPDFSDFGKSLQDALDRLGGAAKTAAIVVCVVAVAVIVFEVRKK